MTTTTSNGTTLYPPAAAQTSGGELFGYAQKLRAETIACRIHHTKMGVRRALTREQIAQAAASFEASAQALCASKRLLDTRHPVYRRVVAARTRASRYWKSISVPYPEPGVRLIRRARLDDFSAQMVHFREELDAAAAELEQHYQELKTAAQESLGALFNASDYPSTIRDEFSLSWDFPNIEPPAYLKHVHPQLYEAECERIRVRFEEAVALTEQMFVQQFHELVGHLADQLNGGLDGKPKRLHTATVENLRGFFEQFKALSVGSSQELDQLVMKAEQLVAGVEVDELRGSDELRTHIGQQLGAIKSSLDAMIVEGPDRAIELPPEAENQEAAA